MPVGFAPGFCGKSAAPVTHGPAEGDARYVRVSPTEGGLEALRQTLNALHDEREAVAEATAELRRHLVAADDA